MKPEKGLFQNGFTDNLRNPKAKAEEKERRISIFQPQYYLAYGRPIQSREDDQIGGTLSPSKSSIHQV